MIDQREHPIDMLPAFAAGSLDAARTPAVESHLLECDECRTVVSEWDVVRSAVHAAAARTPSPSRGLLDRAFAKIDDTSRTPTWRERWWPASFRGRALQRSAAGMAAAAALVLAVAFTPLGSYAQSLFDTTRPQQFAVVPVTLDDLRALPDLERYGEFSFTPGGEPQQHAGASEAGAAMGMSVLTPGDLPASVSAAPAYITLPSQSATFTFSAARAQAAADAQGEALPPMPADIDGASVQMTTGAAVVAMYGASGFLGGASSPPDAGEGGPLAGFADAIPQLLVVQTEAPFATTTGTSVGELRDYLLSQPGISDELANAIRAIGDPTTTWPIPVPAGEIDTREVTVHGVTGTALSERSGFAAAVVWAKDGIVYIVAAPLGEGEVLDIADSLR